MSARSTRHVWGCIVGLLLAWQGLATPVTGADPPPSDVINTSGAPDRFAVGGARRWYDNHPADVKQKAAGCLSLLDEAKTYQDKALALYDEAGRAHDSRKQAELVRQANEQIRLRTEKLRQFMDCVNQAIRQAGRRSDAVDTGSDDGAKSLKRVPGSPSSSALPPQLAFEKAADDCFGKSVPGYRGLDWSSLNATLQPPRPASFDLLFEILGHAADQALVIDQAAYGKWEDPELMRDYLIGWLNHCLTDQKVLPLQDPRIPYRRFMESRNPAEGMDSKRITRRFDEFGFGYRSYPLPPFWDQEPRGPAPPRP